MLSSAEMLVLSGLNRGAGPRTRRPSLLGMVAAVKKKLDPKAATVKMVDGQPVMFQ
jgi:hypothetical protein